MKDRDYKEDIRIDTKNLAGEWEKQGTLLYYWHEQWAHAVRVMNWRKEKLKLVDSEIAMAVRSAPGAYNLEKITDSAISSIVIQSKRHQEAYRDYINAVWEADVLEGAKWAMMHKKSALEALMTLSISHTSLMPHLDKAFLPSDAEYDKKVRDSLQKEVNND